jgi:hypothetical protein
LEQDVFILWYTRVIIEVLLGKVGPAAAEPLPLDALSHSVEDDKPVPAHYCKLSAESIDASAGVQGTPTPTA